VRPPAAVLAATAAWALPAPAPHVPPLCRALRIERRLPAAAGGIWLTFDDGPHPHGTPAVLEALAAAGARATFFLVGEQVERRPALAREIAAAGHGIAVHGHRHRLLLRRGPRAARDDLRRALETIGAATGVAPALHRAPYGVYSWPMLAAVRGAGLRAVLWSRWGRDWRRRATGASVAADATRALSMGDVVLLHDADFYSAPGSWRATAAALPAILEHAAARGLPTVLPTS
jgi:peptidoglycan/xylan/chitin deacetylase (PgdA/CDA1 family)